MTQNETNKTLALAGIFQAAHLVNQMAFSNTFDQTAYSASIKSIFELDPPDTLSVYGSLNNIHTGLSYIKQYCTKKPPFKEKILVKYILYMSELAKKILSNKELFTHLQKRLEPITSQARHLGFTDDRVIAELANLYRQVFLNRRLQVPVLGKINSLKNTQTVDQIYATLIAGIRSAVLWFQLGGSRWQFFFSRKHLLYPS